jgi:DNA-binding transcriptional LysR family regulator
MDELHSFVVLSEELHFGNAARRLFLTPSGLSRRITHLERSLGQQLFWRTTRSVDLTAHGRALLPAARSTVEGLQAFERPAATD